MTLLVLTLCSSAILRLRTACARSMPQTRVAIVTGSAQGIGRAISLRLAADGFDVAVNDVESQRQALETVVDEIQAKGRKAVALLADVSSEKEVKAMVEQTVQRLGRLDVVRSPVFLSDEKKADLVPCCQMVANAGVGGGGSILTSNSDPWTRMSRRRLRFDSFPQWTWNSGISSWA